MVFSVMSMLLAFFTQLSLICQQYRRKRLNFSKQHEMSFLMNIECLQLNKYHAFANKSIENCVNQVLIESPNLINIEYRSDLSYEISVIDITKTMFHNDANLSLSVLFDILLFVNEESIVNSNSNTDINDQIIKEVKDIGNRSTRNYATMVKSLISFLKLRNSGNNSNGVESKTHIQINISSKLLKSLSYEMETGTNKVAMKNKKRISDVDKNPLLGDSGL